MSLERLDLYRGRVMLNLLARDLENALEVAEALDGHVLVGILTKNYDTPEACAADVRAYLEKLPAVSVGLGAGDPKQWKMVAQVAAMTDPGHANEVFAGAFYCQGALAGAGCTGTLVNCLMSPTGTPGLVRISTGEESSRGKPLEVEAGAAMALLRDAGLSSVKFYDIGGTSRLEELRAVAEAAARAGIPVLEPTGGLTPENVGEAVRVCLEAGCQRVIPHVYTSIIDKASGRTLPDLAARAWAAVKAAL